MATIQELEAALINADKAGDVNAAKQLAAAIMQARQEPSLMDELGTQAGLTLRAGAEGLAGVGGLVADPLSALVNQALPDDMQLQPLQQATSNLLTDAGVPMPRNDTEQVIQEASKGLIGAGGMMGIGKALSGAVKPLVAKIGQVLTSQPAAQLAGGAGSGAGAEIAQQEGAGVTGQLAASLAGGVAGASLAAPRTIAKQTSSIAQDIEKQGIKALTSDVIPPKTFAAKWLQSTAEKIPVAGTGGMRQSQQVQRIEAVKDILRQFGADDIANLGDDVMKDLAAKRSDDLIKYASLKNEVIDRLAVTKPVDTTNTVNKIDAEIARFESLKSDKLKPAIEILTDFKGAIQNQSLRNVEDLRKQLGQSLAEPSLAGVKDELQKASGRIYSTLNDDMGSFIKNNGQARDLTKWKVSNRRLAEMQGELKSSALKSVLAKGETTPEMVRKLLFSQKPSEMQLLYKNLSPQGRANARAAILSEAAVRAGGIENISPDRFVTQVDRLGKSVGVFFNQSDKDALNGLTRALNATRRAGQFADNPPTGQQLAIPVGAAVLTDMLGGAGAGIATAGGIGGIARVYESAPVRDILLKLPKVTKGSTEEAALVKRLISTVQAQQSQQNKEQE